MNYKHAILLAAVVAGGLIISRGTTAPGELNIAQQPLYTRASLPPLNMLVMGKDHKIYYEAYNDASDLTGDGVPDVGYKPAIDYYGYFNSYACYTWNGDYFVPASATANKQCGGTAWSGDFLNYLTTSRMDALRRVLYGGWRQTDGDSGVTILQGAFFPQDAHSWGKEYESETRDGYNIAHYAPLSAPAAGKYHLFAVTTTSDNTAPRFRVMENSPYRVWNWLSIEGPVAGNNCFNSSNTRVPCVSGGNQAYPGHPNNRNEYNTLVTNYALPANLFGTDTRDRVDCDNGNCNTQGRDENYLSVILGSFRTTNNGGGTYRFAIDGDDAVDFELRTGSYTGTVVNNSQIGCYGGRGMAGGSNNCATTGDVTLADSTTYYIVFRHEEAGGGDGYRLRWTRTSGNASRQFGWQLLDIDSDTNGNVSNPSGNTFNFSFYDLTPPLPSATTRTDYFVRVQVCPGTEALRDGSCRAYPNGHYKPTGILHDYGMTQRMYFGLITGSQANNLEGGVLRRNISNFADEINATTGQIRTDVNGIVRTLDRLRMVGGGYNGSVTDNLAGDTNWNWANGTGNCPSIGGRAITNGECRMWGNPIAEMLYEAMRYFAGATAATSRFASGGASQGQTEETTMGLTTEAWKDPYLSTAQGGGGYPFCARPFQTVISDINPSYDGDLPGTAWGTAASGDTNPATVSGFNAGTEGNAIWGNEFGGSRSVFIGEVGTTTDGAPTAKTASSFANIRGLAPEEPTKQGTYYSASVARYARNHDINAATSQQSVITYSIALASPLPKIEFPVGGQTVTLLPFAKTVSGTFGGDTRKPTNTIVDFYVQRVANLPGQVQDTTINGGRPLAEFRINYEDVEQGNDHDMDAIVLYEVRANADNTVTVNLTSEYGAGSANQNIGYVISGTTSDGVYLGVRDTDSAQNTSVYEFNTPTGVYAGGCMGAALSTAPCNAGLTFNATHTFTPGDSPGTQLKDPLWYAAKYGGYEDSNNNGLPDLAPEWDGDGNGTPDNYFLVTNPLNLRTQLSKAFDRISNQAGSSGGLAVSGERVNSGAFFVEPSYNSLANGHDWYGDVTAYAVQTNGQAGAVMWRAGARLPTTTAGVGARKIYTALDHFNSSNRATHVKEFRAAQLGGTNTEQFQKLGYNTADITNLFGGSVTPNQLVDYLRGERSMEGDTMNAAPFRRRSQILGDILNSRPVISSKSQNFGWAGASGLAAGVRSAYTSYLASKASGKDYVYVGANDGMLHAFDATNGDEAFAYIPQGVLGLTGYLADRNYGANPQKRYYVDGQIVVGDAYDGSNWKTVMIGAAGAGGRTVFGLDVSSPDTFAASNVLWEVNSQTDGDIGHVMGRPAVVPLEDGSFAALFGNGYNSASSDAVLFVVDAFSGQVKRKIAAADGDDVNPNGLGNIVVVDTNRNGLGDTVYGGDLLGNVWKFDLTSNTAAGWTVAYSGNPLFVARDRDGVRQPITGDLNVSVGPGTGYMVYFGTGRYFVVGDNNSSTGQQVQSLYGIWDGGSTITGSRASVLVEQAITGQDGSVRTSTRNAVNYLTHSGWYLDLIVGTADTGERFIAAPGINNGRIEFTTYQPGINSDCQPGGQNYSYVLNMLTGGAALGPATTSSGGSIPGSTGGLATTTGAPSSGAVFTRPPGVYPPLYCDPLDPTCTGTGTPGAKCTVVLNHSIAVSSTSVLACGRQSWRQLQ